MIVYFELEHSGYICPNDCSGHGYCSMSSDECLSCNEGKADRDCSIDITDISKNKNLEYNIVNDQSLYLKIQIADCVQKTDKTATLELSLISGGVFLFGKNKLRGYEYKFRQDYIPSEYLYSDICELKDANSTCQIAFSLDTQISYIIALKNMVGSINSHVNLKLLYPKCNKMDSELVKTIILFVSVIGFIILVTVIIVLIKCVFCKRNGTRQQREKEDRIKKLDKIIPNRKHTQVVRFFEYMNAPDKKLVECTICLQKFTADEIVKVLFCLHYFHEKCIMNWIHENAYCPLCKYNLEKTESIEISIDSKKFTYADTIGNYKFMSSLKASPKENETLNELVTSCPYGFHSTNSSNGSIPSNEADVVVLEPGQHRKKKKTVQIRKKQTIS